MSAPLLRQLHPLKIKPKTNEVYLQLAAPLQNIIITPPRLSDAPAITQILNDPRVYKTLEGPPCPYLLEHAESWITSVKKESDVVLKALEDVAEKERQIEHGAAGLVVVNGCPVRALREVQDDGTDIFLGDIGISRCVRFHYLRNEGEEAALVTRNAALATGDPEIIWTIGYYLAASHHDKGIMSAALRTIMLDWAIPRMNARRGLGLAFKGNAGSVKVFQKNGFEMIDTVEDCVVIPESKGGGVVGLHFLRWSN
ncbi:GNAT domain-containing protein [Phellopilus nigrolimitatus]|nr:GNAT domain-containing protein [Phellopilus nigrolimitatus]